MKIYRVNIQRPFTGTEVHWFASKGKADRFIKQVIKCSGEYNGADDAGVIEIDFKPTKTDVLKLLIQYAPDYDNG